MTQKELNEHRIKLGQILKNKRLKSNTTKMELSRRTRLTRPTIDAIENAIHPYSIDSYLIYLGGVE
jgi:transcriptional regulator with XRE-family HTH domain